jgi:hypothetical protein
VGFYGLCLKFLLSVLKSHVPDKLQEVLKILYAYFTSDHLAVPLVKRLDAGFPPRRPGFASGQLVGFVVDKAALGQVFSEHYSLPCQSCHQFLRHHNHPGLAQKATGGRSAEWTQLGSTPTISILLITSDH